MDKKTLELKELQQETIKTTMLDIPGGMMVGLALYAKFGSNGEPFHPALNNQSVVMGLFIVGGAIMLWCSSRILSISKRRRELEGG